MARKKDSKPAMMLLPSGRNAIEMLTDEEAGKLFKAIYAYYCDGDEIKSESRVMRLVFDQLKSMIDAHNEYYTARCARNKEIAEERERKKREQNRTNVNERERTYTNVNERTPIEDEVEVEDEVEYSLRNNLNNNISHNAPRAHTHAYTHEGLTDYIEEAKTDQSYIEMLSMALHQPPDKVISLLSDFALECRAKDTAHTSRKDFRSHFFDWARIQTEKKPKGRNNKQSSEPTDINDLWK